MCLTLICWINVADAQAGPKIAGPYFWMIAATENTGSADAASSGTDWLSEASKGAVTEEADCDSRRD